MKTYKQFHGQIEIDNIGKELRNIVKKEKENFKILTGYGSNSGRSESKIKAIKSLNKMYKEGLIKGYLPGEAKNTLYKDTDNIYKHKEKFKRYVIKDSDYGNDGIIFVFIKE